MGHFLIIYNPFVINLFRLHFCCSSSGIDFCQQFLTIQQMRI